MGASFLVEKASTVGGIKSKLHEFPNSNKQNVEQLGLKPRTMTVNGIISGTDYIQKRDKLLSVIEGGGTGLLVHPFYGNFENMACLTFSLVEDFTALGDAKITMVFTVSNDIGLPKGTKNNSSYLSGLNKSVQDAMNKDLANVFSVSSLSNSFRNATDTMNRMFVSFDEKTEVVAQSIDAMNEFSSLINAFSTNINNLSRKPQEFADAFSNIQSNINGLYAVVSNVSVTGNQSVTTASDESIRATKTLAAYAGMFDFDDDIVDAENTTNSRINNNLNNSVMKQAMQLSALGYSYLNASSVEYSTTTEIEERAADLEKQYQKVLSNNDSLHAINSLSFKPKTLDQTTVLALQDLRNATQDLFDDVKLTTNKIIEIDSAEMPASVLTFQYYGGLDLQNDIIELNPDKNVSFFSDTVNILGL